MNMHRNRFDQIAQNPDEPFIAWLAGLLKCELADARQLIEDRLALRFLITWSIFEAKCFSGFMRVENINSFAQKKHEVASQNLIEEAARHFHLRYQNKEKLRNLLYKSANYIQDELIKSFEELSPEEKIKMVLFVVYRFRNNIFHGNKRVESWLRYREQIEHCISVMQVITTHTERNHPTIQIED